MPARSLRDARRLFRARRFADVIRLLEPEVFRHRENADYFLMLGASCLHTGDLGGATSYLSRARQLRPGSVGALLGLAAVHLRRAETETALKLWLEVLEEDPRNAVARRGLNLLRRGLSREALQEMVEAGRLRQLYPPLPGRPRWAVAAVAVLGSALILLAGLLAWRVLRPAPPPRPGVAEVSLPTGGAALVEPASSGATVLSEREVGRLFAEAKRQLLAYRDNLACVALNRILLSNATPAVKERAAMLKGFLARPSFDSLRDAPAYRDVARDPRRFDGCYVAWKGKLANLAVAADAIAFDLLVGYQQERELEGVVPVRVGFATQLEDGIGIEVLGRVDTAQGDLRLEGVSLHRLVE